MRIKEIIDTAGRRIKVNWKQLGMFQLAVIIILLILTLFEYVLNRGVAQQSLKWLSLLF